MPKVTLLSAPWEDYRLLLGKGAYTFIGGEPKDVPTAVALRCQKLKKEGVAMFEVADLPTVIKKKVEEKIAVVQNVKRSTRHITNLRFFEAEVLCQ